MRAQVIYNQENQKNISIDLLAGNKIGPQGLKGDSAYTVAKKNGFSGTEEQWLASLKGQTGDIGPQGQKGDKGDTGATGPQGQKGDRGQKGQKGQKGDTGMEGPQGPRGQIGPQGPKGDTGERGPRGYPGEKGERGYPFTYEDFTQQQLEGLRGPQGIQGQQGPKGDKGDTGAQGPQGIEGPQGIQGPPGIQGETGPQGLKGDKGDKGEKGQKGDKGDPGNLNFYICSSSEYNSETRKPTVSNPDGNTFYLVPAESETSSDLFVEWIYVNNKWEMFGSATVDLSDYITDVQIDGNSIVNNGVATIPIAADNVAGVVKVNDDYGISIGENDKILKIQKATSTQIKNGVNNYVPIVPEHQHESAFYGLAKAAGDVTQAQSSSSVGTYTADAKDAIKLMLGIESEGFNITDPNNDGNFILTTSSDPTNTDVLANHYNANGVYVVGDYCIYENHLYKCNTAIPSGEAWNLNHWERINLTDEISDVKGDLNDLESYTKGGLYEDDVIETQSGYTIDIVTGKTKTGSGRRCIFDFMPIKDATYIEVVCTDPSHSSATDQGYKIYEYSDASEASYLGGYPAGTTWYWTDQKRFIYLSDLQYSGDYIRLVFYSTLEVTVKVHYAGRTTGGLLSRIETLESTSATISDVTNLETQVDDMSDVIDGTETARLNSEIKGQKLIPALIYGTITTNTGAMSPAKSGSSDSEKNTTRIRVNGIRNLRCIHLKDSAIQVKLFYYNLVNEAPVYLGESSDFFHDEYVYPTDYVCDFVSVIFRTDSTIEMDDIRDGVDVYADPINYAYSTSINSSTKLYQTTADYITKRLSTHFIDIDEYPAAVFSDTFNALIYYYNSDFEFVGREIPFTARDGLVKFTGFKYAVITFNIESTTLSHVIDNVGLMDKYELASRSIEDAESKTHYYTGEAINTYKVTPLSFPSFSYNQDGDVYGSKLVRVSSDGAVKVIDIKTGSLLKECTITDTDHMPHANSAFFGPDKYDSNDDFPILFVNRYNNTPEVRGALYGYRLWNNNGVFTATLVTTITIGFTTDSLWTTGNDNRPFGNFLSDGTYLWAYTTLDGSVNVTRFFKFAFPTLSATVTLSTSDVIDHFDVDKQPYPQGCAYYNGLAFCQYEWTGNMDVVDLTKKQTISKFDFASTDVAGEPELIAFYNGNMIYGSADKYALVVL